MKISLRINNWYKLKKVEDTIGKYICIGPILIEWGFKDRTRFIDWRDC